MNHNTRTNDRKNRQNKYEFFMFKKVLYVAPNIFHGVPSTKKQRQRFALQELLKYNVFATVPPL